MRKLIYAINITLDGCCEHTKMKGTEELMDHYTQLLRDADLLVYGRKTYQLMVPYWPDIAKSQSENRAENEFARAFDALDRIVVSQSLDHAEGNTKIVRTNLKDEILKLKQQPGKNILTGGVALPAQLIELGLVDECHFVILPILGGEGRRLLEGLNQPQKFQLKLADSKLLKSGSLALRYLIP